MGREIGEKCNIADIFRYDFSIFFRGCKQPKSVHISKAAANIHHFYQTLYISSIFFIYLCTRYNILYNNVLEDMKKLLYLLTGIVATTFTACVSMNEDNFPSGRELSGDEGILVYDVACPDDALNFMDLEFTYVDFDSVSLKTVTKTERISKRSENSNVFYLIIGSGRQDTIVNELSQNTIETVYLNTNNSTYTKEYMDHYFAYSKFIKVPYGREGFELSVKYTTKTGGEVALTRKSDEGEITALIGRASGLIHRRAANDGLTQLDYPPFLVYGLANIAPENAASYLRTMEDYDWLNSYATFPSYEFAKTHKYIMSSVKAYEDCYGVNYTQKNDLSKLLQ